MEYIQCSHCQKKYSVSDKIRAAVGKKIRCKGCNQAFEIIVLGGQEDNVAPKQEKSVGTDPVTEKNPLSTTEQKNVNKKASHLQPTHQQASKKTEKKPKPSLEEKVKEKRNGRFVMVSIFFGLLILIAMGGLAYLYIEKPELFESWSKQMYAEEDQTLAQLKPAKETEVSEPMSTPNNGTLGPSLPTGFVGPTPASGPPVPEIKRKDYRDFIEASISCREAAAQQWMVDYLISHMTYSGADYIQMLDQSSEHSASMRENCKDNALIAEITAAAREGKKPFWIQAAVDAMQKQQLDAAAESAY